MSKCDLCGKTFLMGGKTVGEKKYCSDDCVQSAPILARAAQLSPDEIEPELRELHQSQCPKCNGPGPIDVHTSHNIYSFVYVTQWNSKTHLCCRACARKEQYKSLALAAVLGWWGFPWGFIYTPIQIGKNIAGIRGGPNSETPSPELREIVRNDIAQRLLTQESAAPQIANVPLQSQPISSQPISSPPAANRPIDAPPRTPAAPKRGSTPGMGKAPSPSPFSDSNPFN